MDCSCKHKYAELLGKVKSGTGEGRFPLPTHLSCWFLNKIHQFDDKGMLEVFLRTFGFRLEVRPLSDVKESA